MDLVSEINVYIIIIIIIINIMLPLPLSVSELSLGFHFVLWNCILSMPVFPQFSTFSLQFLFT